MLGLYTGVLVFKCKDTLLRFIAALLFATGVGSALFHGTLWAGMSSYDVGGMNWLVNMISLALSEGIIAFWVHRVALKHTQSNTENTALIRSQEGKSAWASFKSKMQWLVRFEGGFDVTTHKWYTIPTMILNLLAVLWQLFVNQASDIEGGRWIPQTVMVAVPLVVATCFSISYFIYCFIRRGKDTPKKTQQKKKLFYMLLGAIVVMVIAVVFHVVDDPNALCDDKNGPIIVYFFPHTFWHLLTAYSVLLVFVPAYYFRHRYVYNHPKHHAMTMRFFCLCPYIREGEIEQEEPDSWCCCPRMVNKQDKEETSNKDEEEEQKNSKPDIESSKIGLEAEVQ